MLDRTKPQIPNDVRASVPSRPHSTTAPPRTPVVDPQASGHAPRVFLQQGRCEETRCLANRTGT
ncbi:hypothetical protein N656DRAFT_773267 [Canariomyces notabilis]|uniref:Uncharacterized protein n=1 Tax=Canariomyces notabilis TaxID=2074819 RepID=A0AAN6TMJ9_9PEZI|nr:hypothetical protein N656DRAFT_773267 [Canariomyces arenarius]